VDCSLFGAISGQNVITHPDLKKACRLAFEYLSQCIGEEFECKRPRIDETRPIIISSVDLVRHYKNRSRCDVSNLLAAIYADQSHDGLVIGHAVKGGRHESVKIDFPDLGLAVQFYDKFAHLQTPRNKLPRKLPHREELLKMTERWVRMEVTAGQKALERHNATNLANWTIEVRNRIFREVFHALKFEGKFQTMSPDIFLGNLSRTHLRTYRRWENGEGLGDYKRSTLARQSKHIWERTGIDIGTEPPMSTKKQMAIGDVFSRERKVNITKEQMAKWVPCWTGVSP